MGRPTIFAATSARRHSFPYPLASPKPAVDDTHSSFVMQSLVKPFKQEMGLP
jgi:hypothetical protein